MPVQYSKVLKLTVQHIVQLNLIIQHNVLLDLTVHHSALQYNVVVNCTLQPKIIEHIYYKIRVKSGAALLTPLSLIRQLSNPLVKIDEI